MFIIKYVVSRGRSLSKFNIQCISCHVTTIFLNPNAKKWIYFCDVCCFNIAINDSGLCYRSYPVPKKISWIKRCKMIRKSLLLSIVLMWGLRMGRLLRSSRQNKSRWQPEPSSRYTSSTKIVSNVIQIAENKKKENFQQ